MPHCFVIQPFDDGKFDKRFADVFKPAIEAAGLDPYRVDRDPSVSIPIDEIETGIRTASLCFADVTLDNPNVWFELGYALATEKEVCVICSEERTTRYPFDIQHRNIIRYRVESASDYAMLQAAITARIKAIEGKGQKLAALASGSPLKEGLGLSQHEMIVLASIMENMNGPGEAISHWTLKSDLERAGYNNIALNLGIQKLLRKDMISSQQEQDRDGDPYNVYSLRENGLTWLLDNSDRLNLVFTKTRIPPINTFSVDDEIPF